MNTAKPTSVRGDGPATEAAEPTDWAGDLAAIAHSAAVDMLPPPLAIRLSCDGDLPQVQVAVGDAPPWLAALTGRATRHIPYSNRGGRSTHHYTTGWLDGVRIVLVHVVVRHGDPSTEVAL
ncbi:MAG: hypothetical protein ACRDP1_12205 [Nocardioidaceae bacterium]